MIRIIGIIIREIENSFSKNTFLASFRMAHLPSLCKKFVQLVELLVSNFNRWKCTNLFISRAKHMLLKLCLVTERQWWSQTRYCSIVVARHAWGCHSRYDGEWEPVLVLLSMKDFAFLHINMCVLTMFLVSVAVNWLNLDTVTKMRDNYLREPIQSQQSFSLLLSQHNGMNRCLFETEV